MPSFSAIRQVILDECMLMRTDFDCYILFSFACIFAVYFTTVYITKKTLAVVLSQ